MGRSLRRVMGSALAYAFILAVTLPVILLYVLLFLTSFATDMEGIVPKGFTLKNWEFIVSGNIRVPGAEYQYPNLYLVMGNTFLLAISVAGAEMFLASLAGYAISRFRFRGRSLLMGTILVLHAFPGVALLIAIFYILNALGLYDTLVGVFIIKVALDLPLAIWIMKGFFDGIPWDLEMSALIDGCSRFQAWLRVILPNVRNGLMAVLIFGFLSGWSEFIYILTFISSQKYWTLSMLVYAFTSGEYFYINPGVTATIAIIYMLPVVAFFLFAQKYLLRIQIAGKGVV
ncbi:MAG: carbohydrate ABC transporter permease [Thermoprotei archaeon]|nr:MAG: carbohydrate ABC transporter permease [Thermoprotei archaeon]